MFVIAELGLNHNGNVDLALELVDAAAAAGASAIKLQVFAAARLVTADAPAPAHVEAASLRDLFRGYELDEGACRAVIARARAQGLAVLATPFDLGAVQILATLGVDAFKIASGDLTYARLIEAAGATGRPIVMSTGMSEQEEVDRAIGWARDAGAEVVALLHCVSAYPTPSDQQNLRAIQTLARACRVPVGLSDHGMGRDAALLAYALGATLYERHLHLPGSGAIDEPVSSSPDQLRDIVMMLAVARAALGAGLRAPMPAELANIVPSRRGLYAARALSPGDVIGVEDVAALRPATCIGAHADDALVGARVSRTIPLGTAFQPADLTVDASRRDRGPLVAKEPPRAT